jgi:hypothetical protein
MKSVLFIKSIQNTLFKKLNIKVPYNLHRLKYLIFNIGSLLLFILST